MHRQLSNHPNTRFTIARCRSRCPEITGPSRRGGLVGVMCRTCLLLRADFFAFRFVSDLRRRQPIATIQEFFSDGSSETKWPLGSKRNALPKRAGKPPEGSRRNLRDTGGEKKSSGIPAWPAAKKTFARRDALRSCTRNSRTRSADQVRQIAASIRRSGFTGPVLFAGRQAGRGVNRRPGMSGLHRRS